MFITSGNEENHVTGTTVSYTHLDVYKRQEMFTRLADAASTGADTLIAIPSAVVNASIVCFFMIFLHL